MCLFNVLYNVVAVFAKWNFSPHRLEPYHIQGRWRNVRQSPFRTVKGGASMWREVAAYVLIRKMVNSNYK